MFDAVFTMESLMGDRFQKVVSLLPHEGAPTVAGTPAASGATG